MYLHSMPVKMAAAASKAICKLPKCGRKLPLTFKKQGEGFFISTASSEVPDIERGDLEQDLKKAPLFLAIIFSHFCVFLAEQWNHDVTASSKTGILPNCKRQRSV